MSNFEEKSGIVAHKTEWGRWYQTVSEVTIEVDLEPGTRGKEVQCQIKPNHLSCKVRDKLLFEVKFSNHFSLENPFQCFCFQGPLFSTVFEDESVWTIEDRKLLRIQLIKSDQKTKDKCWLSLLQGQFQPDTLTLTEMRKKLDLERFQLENPGMDFSGAKLDKRYEDQSIKQMEDAVKNS